MTHERWEFAHVPHDYVIFGTPDEREHDALGFLRYDNACYRRHFQMPEGTEGKRVLLCVTDFCFQGKLAWDVLLLGAPAGMSIVSYTFPQMVTTGFITGLGIAVINTKIYMANIVAYHIRKNL